MSYRLPTPTGIKRIESTPETLAKLGTALKEMPTQYAIYMNPKDYPDKFVLRPWRWSAMEQKYVPCDVAAVEDKIEAIRRRLPKGLLLLRKNKRYVNIVEVWI